MGRSTPLLGLVALCGALASGCGGSSGEAPIPLRDRAEKVAPAPAPQATLKVSVVLDGAAAFPRRTHGSGPCALPPPTPGAQGALPDVAVWADQGAEAPKPRAGSMTLGACAASPPLLVLPPGSAISVSNPTGAARELSLRLASAASDAAPFAVRTLAAGAVAGVSLPTSGRASLSCTGEPCEGDVVVAEVGGLTDAAGAVTLRGVRPGAVVVRAWHPALGEVEGSVDAPAGGEAALTLRFTVPAEPR